MTPKAVAARERRAGRGDVRTCAQCGGEFLALRTDAKYCRPECLWAAQSTYRYSARDCSTCGGTFRPTNKTQAFCSLTCRPHHGGGRPPIAPEVLAHRAVLHEIQVLKRRLVRLETRSEREGWERPCIGCGDPVGSGHGSNGLNGSKRYCSKACYQALTRRHESPAMARRAAKERRRARKQGAFVADVNRRDVYERDEWTCQLCGQPVDPEATVPEPTAPTIDHVLALANGGTHEPGNVQLAHFLCNALKGDRQGVWISPVRAKREGAVLRECESPMRVPPPQRISHQQDLNPTTFVTLAEGRKW